MEKNKLISNELKRELIKTFLEKYGELYISMGYDMIADIKGYDGQGNVYIGYSYNFFESVKTTIETYKVSRDFFDRNFMKIKDYVSLETGLEIINYNLGIDTFELSSNDNLRRQRDFGNPEFHKW